MENKERRGHHDDEPHPVSFAGSWKQYSKKALPQLTAATVYSALPSRKCSFHATIMNILNIVSSGIAPSPP